MVNMERKDLLGEATESFREEGLFNNVLKVKSVSLGGKYQKVHLKRPDMFRELRRLVL